MYRLYNRFNAFYAFNACSGFGLNNYIVAVAACRPGLAACHDRPCAFDIVDLLGHYAFLPDDYIKIGGNAF